MRVRTIKAGTNFSKGTIRGGSFLSYSSARNLFLLVLKLTKSLSY
ncbi:MAG: hypothetical protein ACK42G_02295 [Candidatus Kapaibacteriota bacterium]